MKAQHTQNINLLPRDLLGAQDKLSFANTVMLTLLVSTLLGGYGGYQYFQEHKLKEDLDLVTQTTQVTQLQIDSMRTQLQEAPPENIDVQIERLQEKVQKKEEEVMAFRSSSGTTHSGSQWLSTLGKHRVRGIWFEEIRLYPESKHIELKGSTQQAHLLPELIHKLAKAEAAAGLQFANASMQADEDSSLVKFSLSTKASKKSEKTK